MNQVITLYDCHVSKTLRGTLEFRTLTTNYFDPLYYVGELVTVPDLEIGQKLDQLLGIVETDLQQVMNTLTVWNYYWGARYYHFSSVYLRNEQLALYLKRLSLLCLTLSILGLVMVSAPVVVAEFKYSLLPSINHSINLTTEGKIRDSLITSQQSLPELPMDINDFSITVPKINLQAKVIPEVDPTNEVEYTEKLKQGVAHAKGSYLPGQGGPIFLFSHSTDSIFDISEYDALFYGIKDLKVGDEITINFEGKQYKYKMTGQKIISADDLSNIQNSKADLILSTCYPPGTTWKRLLVLADKD